MCHSFIHLFVIFFLYSTDKHVAFALIRQSIHRITRLIMKFFNPFCTFTWFHPFTHLRSPMNYLWLIPFLYSSMRLTCRLHLIPSLTHLTHADDSPMFCDSSIRLIQVTYLPPLPHLLTHPLVSFIQPVFLLIHKNSSR